MKAWKIAGISAVVVLALAALGAGFAFAQTPTPPAPGYGWGGMMGGGNGMMGGFGQDGGNYAGMNNMHQWMFSTGARSVHTLVWNGVADALGLTSDQLNTELASGKTLAQIAQAQGVSQEQLTTVLEESAKAGLDKAVADGILTQAQADWMQSHMGGNYGWMLTHMGNFAGGRGVGGCHSNSASHATRNS